MENTNRGVPLHAPTHEGVFSPPPFVVPYRSSLTIKEGRFQVLGTLFYYLPKDFSDALNIEQIRALNKAFHKYQEDEEADFNTRLLSLLTLRPLPSHIRSYCLSWLGLNCPVLRSDKYFGCAIRLLCVAQIHKGSVHDLDYKRILNLKSVSIDRNRLVKLELLDQVPGAGKTTISKMGRTLLKLALKAIELRECQVYTSLNI